MNQAYKTAYDKLLRHEGGYSDRPEDRGGETYKGISRKYHPEWAGWFIVDNLKSDHTGEMSVGNWTGLDMALDRNDTIQALVQDFYHDEYWEPIGGNAVPALVGMELLDIGVNMGRATAVRFLQRACNLFNNRGRYWKDISEDGKFGPQTSGTVQKFCAARNGTGEAVLIKVLNAMQANRYLSLMGADDSQEAFAWGWFTRV